MPPFAPPKGTSTIAVFHVADENLERPVVHPHRYLDPHLTIRCLEQQPKVL
jgi:hypothetical protein